MQVIQKKVFLKNHFKSGRPRSGHADSVGVIGSGNLEMRFFRGIPNRDSWYQNSGSGDFFLRMILKSLAFKISPDCLSLAFPGEFFLEDRDPENSDKNQPLTYYMFTPDINIRLWGWFGGPILCFKIKMSVSIYFSLFGENRGYWLEPPLNIHR